MIPLGIRIYGAGAMALGLVGLAWRDFALQWQPVTASLPGRTALACVFATLLVLAGTAINWRPVAVKGAAALTCLYGVDVVLMHGAQLVEHPGLFATWSGLAEQLTLLAAGLTAFAVLADPAPPARIHRIAQAAMGLCLLTFGIAHFIYLDFTASMVPAWLPGTQRFWAAATGVAHLAAAVAFLSNIQVRLSALLLTIMFATFGALVHLPLLVVDPHSHISWVMNAVNLALTGAAWTFIDRPESMPSRVAGQLI